MLSSSSSTSSMGVGGTALMSAVSSMPSSPSGEMTDNAASRFNAHLRRVAGQSEEEENPVFRDHSYARPWNWKPENIYVKPVKKLFFARSEESLCKREKNLEDHVDVEEIIVDDATLPYDFTRTHHQMEEFQRLANFARPLEDEEEDGDWEEKIEKVLWLPVHHRIFSKVMRILTSERLARLAKSNSTTEPIFRRISIDTAARRFRETLASTGWNWQMTQWLHGLLFERLPREYLAIYLDILQTLRLKIPQLIDRMMSAQPNINGKASSITWETLSSLLKRSWDPIAPSLNANRPKKLPGNPILILVPSGISTNASSRQHKWISQLGNLGMIVNVHTHMGIAANRMTMTTCMDQLVQATRAKIQDVRGDCPGRPIILIGFNSGAALACQVAQLEHVTAVVCMGFPFMTVEGKRGTPDDTLMDMRCPVMFVIGEHASLVRPDDIEDVREKMMVETSLVVVGTADDHLRVSTNKKIAEGITQAVVDRCVLDEVGDFLATILLQPHPLPLRQRTILNYENSRSTKKEHRKRKNSTSSSVDSESNSPNVKKSRPTTPISSSIATSIANLVQPSITARSTSQFSPMTIGSTSIAPHTCQATSHRKKTKASNSQKYNFPDNKMSARHNSQGQQTSGNGGITLNIGSLASLAPIGPIRLTASGGIQQTVTMPSSTKANVISRSPMTMTKISKIVQTKISQTPTKIKTSVPTTPKTFQKIGGNNFNNVNVRPCGSVELKHVTSTSSVNAASQTKSSPSTSGLTNFLQTGKNNFGFPVNNTTRGPIVQASGVSTSSFGTNTLPTTVTTSPAAKVMDIEACDSDRIDDSTIGSTKIQHPNDGSSVCNAGKNSNKTPITIMPLSSQRANSSQSSASKIVPKITMNNKLQSCATALPPNVSIVQKKTFSKDIDDQLDNILDIPIIFAQDTDNLNIIENLAQPPQIPVGNPVDANVESGKSMKRSTTKVVLISNKQDKGKIGLNSSGPNFSRPLTNMLNQQSSQQIFLQQPRTQQHPSQISFGTNWPTSIQQPMQTRSNPPTIKYTKIILAKRTSGTGSADKTEQVVLTKGVPKISKEIPARLEKQNHHQVPIKITSIQEGLEIEDAIKTNIIERTFLSIPEIDLTSPTKKSTESLALIELGGDSICPLAPDKTEKGNSIEEKF